MSMDSACELAVAAINRGDDEKNSKNIRIAQITRDEKTFEVLDEEKIKQFIESAKTKYPKESK